MYKIYFNKMIKWEGPEVYVQNLIDMDTVIFIYDIPPPNRFNAMEIIEMRDSMGRVSLSLGT